MASCASSPQTPLRGLLLQLRTPFWPDGRPWAAGGAPAVPLEDREPYLEALGREALSRADERLARLLAELRDAYGLADNGAGPAEVNLEAYPGMLDGRGLDGLRACGATRLVVDYGTGSAAEARELGRVVASEGLAELDGALRGCGLSVEVRLLVGGPGQSAEAAVESLQKALGFGAAAVNLETFRLDPGSPLARERLRHDTAWRTDALHAVPSAAMRVETQGRLADVLRAEGFVEQLPGYWALPGREGRYRLMRAAGCDVLGCGLGARTRIDGAVACNTGDLEVYLASADDPERRVASRWSEAG